MTNFERITASPEALTEWYISLHFGKDATITSHTRSKLAADMEDWLESEAKQEG